MHGNNTDSKYYNILPVVQDSKNEYELKYRESHRGTNFQQEFSVLL